ncbi:hypothetical protein GGR51DRAFT_578178 [Nemania sp. FL0031]|nr:hypothetical protein GGR51DRAFT_578178 [Nemania sp. FL0031]
MYNFFDSRVLSRQLQAKTEAAALAGQLDGDSSYHGAAQPKSPRPNSACDWQGDPPEPELDDLAHLPPKKEQPRRSAEACDWRGDEPEQHEDDLGQICQSDSRDQKSTRRDKAVEEANVIEMPIPRAPNTGIPQIIFPLQEHNSTDQKHDPKAPSDRPVQDGKQSESGKKTRKKKARAGVTISPGQINRETANESPTEDKTHSPWVDSLEHMSTAVMDRVNIGVKQTLDAATSILTPSTYKKPASPEPARKPSGLAPPSVAPHPSEFYVPRAPKHDVQVDNKKQGREKARLEKKAQREAKRKARQAKKNERREKRRAAKEKRRNERQRKRAVKKGGELPAHILQGLRTAPDSKIQYHPGCDICKKSATATTSSKKHDSECTICAKQADRESTNQYLKSQKINLAALPSVDDLINAIKKLLGKEAETAEGGSGSDQAHTDEELAHHITLHVQDFATSGGEANLRGHKCNNEGQPGHSGHHGLDRNRDSPTATDAGKMVPISYRNSEPLTMPVPSEVDWWAQALSSEMSASTPYRSNSTPFAVPLLPR